MVLRSVIRAALVLSLPCALNAQRVWLQQGPGPNTAGQVEGITNGEVVGAIKTVAAHPTSADIVFVGAVNGGIWRTGNATTASPAWVPQLGADQALNIGAIAFDPTDLPLSAPYLDSIASVPNVIILNRSKWLNQVLIRTTDPAALAAIRSFSFVRQSFPAGAGAGTSGRSFRSAACDAATRWRLRAGLLA